MSSLGGTRSDNVIDIILNDVTYQFAKGIYTCPWNIFDVWTVLMCGKYDIAMIWERSWKLPVIMAWEATIAAKTAMTRLK